MRLPLQVLVQAHLRVHSLGHRIILITAAPSLFRYVTWPCRHATHLLRIIILQNWQQADIQGAIPVRNLRITNTTAIGDPRVAPT